MLQNIPKEKVLEIVSQGPTLPAKIAKQVGGDTMLIGAILSTIISTGKIRVSTLKIGGSPLYYIPEQESKLEEYIDHLNEKDRRTFQLLKEQKVLRDDSQNPLTQVSLKAIKDFAKPFFIEQSGIKALYWRFYNIPQEQAELIAEKIPGKILSSEQAQQEEIVQPSIAKPSIVVQSQQIDMQADVQVPKPRLAPSRDIEPLSINAIPRDRIAKVELRQEPAIQQPQALQKDQIPEGLAEDKHIQHKVHAKTLHPVHHASHPKKTRTTRPVHPKEKPAKTEDKRDFYEVILEFISNNGLDLISKEKIKKSEYNIILKNHSNNEFIYCKAKDKSSITEADLAPALIFAQNKKMPCLFLSTGELAKKTADMMDKEFNAVTFKRLDNTAKKPNINIDTIA